MFWCASFLSTVHKFIAQKNINNEHLYSADLWCFSSTACACNMIEVNESYYSAMVSLWVLGWPFPIVNCLFYNKSHQTD